MFSILYCLYELAVELPPEVGTSFIAHISPFVGVTEKAEEIGIVSFPSEVLILPVVRVLSSIMVSSAYCKFNKLPLLSTALSIWRRVKSILAAFIS